MTASEVAEFAKASGYDGCEYSGDWNGFKVYEPFFETESPSDFVCVGLPRVILVSGGTIRLSTPEEAFSFMDFKYPESEESVD